MKNLEEILYYKLRKKEIDKAKVVLKKIKMDMVFNAITNNCWKNGIQYETLIKNNEVLVMKLNGKKEVVLLKFHKSDMVFAEDYERLVLIMDELGIKKGIYITTGVFEAKIIKNLKKPFSTFHNIKIENNLAFIRGQLGLTGKAVDIFKYKKLTFLNYLPN